jgi:spermidine synthase
MEVKTYAMTRRIPLHLPAVISLGIVCQLGQIVFLRELLMVFHGNELSIGIIFSAWMIWVGVGSRVGAIVVERLSRPIYLVFVTAAAALCTLPATILLIRALRGFFDVLPGAYLSFLDLSTSCFILMGPVCLLLGVQFVLLARVWRENDRVGDTSGAAKTYIGEAAGNAVGGILFTFLLVHHLNSFQSAVLAGMLMVGATLWLTRETRRDADRATARKRLALTGLLVASGIVFPFLKDVDAWAYRLQWRLFAPEHRLIATHQSKYGAIAVVQREDQYSFFQSGHLVFSSAGPEARTVALEEQEAVVFAHFDNCRAGRTGGGGIRPLLVGAARKSQTHSADRWRLAWHAEGDREAPGGED